MTNDHKPVDVKTGAFFPWPFRFLAALGVFFSVPLVLSKPLLGSIAFLGSLAVVSAYQGTQVNTTSKRYREYVSFLFIKFGSWVKYNLIEKIFFNTSKVSQQYHTAHTSHSSTFLNVEYNAYLKFDNGTKVYLLSKKEKAKLLGLLEGVSKSLNTYVEDNT